MKFCKNCKHLVEEYIFSPTAMVYDANHEGHIITSRTEEKILMHAGMVQVCQAGLECQCRQAVV